MLDHAGNIVNEKKNDELVESKDVMVYTLVANREKSDMWVNVIELTNTLRFIVGEESAKDWLTPIWLGKALKRLNLIKSKKRVGKGIQVILDVEKAKIKERLFKSDDK